MKKLFLLLILAITLATYAIALETTQKVTVTVLPGDIDIYSPIQKGIYSERMVPINLSMSSEVNSFKYSDNGDRLRTLCRNCDEYGFTKLKRKPFDDGFHELTIAAIFDAGTIYKYINFTVDSKAPRITKTEPKRGFASGDFEIQFLEENPALVALHYGSKNPGQETKNLDINNDCHIDRGKHYCKINVDLEEYDEEEIEYWFEVEDIAGNTDESKPTKVNVDMTGPILNNPYSFWEQGKGKYNKYIYFNINITEKNFEEISYIDLNDSKPRTRALCTRLKKGICEKRTRFGKGDHVLDIQISDEAGNTIAERIEFDVL